MAKVIKARILVETQKDGSATQKINGFEIPVGAGEFEVGKVTSVGPEVEGVVEGDTIYMQPGCGHVVTLDGKKYKVISTADVLIVL